MTKMQSVKELKVFLQFNNESMCVGQLALNNRTIYFEYDKNFIEQGLEISPIRLPLSTGVQIFNPQIFEGLPGVFFDSLSDGWGRLLFDRCMRGRGILPNEISVLDRLAYIGDNHLGALTYKPTLQLSDQQNCLIDLDIFNKEAKKILIGESSALLENLIKLNASSHGARPKALIGFCKDTNNIVHGTQELPKNYDYWIVKFSNSQDGIDAGAIEYCFSLMAKAAGVEIPKTHLFTAKHGPGYFAVERFDRNHKQKYHMHTVSGLLHSDFRTPALDYEDLIALTGLLTKDIREIEKMFRLAVFNVLAHNRDDHAKNFSFLMDEKGQWRLSPGYDLTFSSGPNAEQSMMVIGEGKNPTIGHLIKLGEKAKISKTKVKEIISQTKDSLSLWTKIAKKHGVAKENIELISKRIEALLKS